MGIDPVAHRKNKKRIKGKHATSNQQLICCPVCGKSISRRAESCPQCGDQVDLSVRVEGLQTFAARRNVMTAAEKSEMTKAVITIVSIAIMVYLWFLWPFSTKSPPGKKVLSPYQNQERAVRPIAMLIVQDALKSPATASFFKGHPPSSFFDKSSGEWTVYGDVDSQNSFGAMLRMQYTVTLYPEEDCQNYNKLACWEVTKRPKIY